MPTTTFQSSTDKGQVIHVNDFIKDPALVQSTMAAMTDKQFIADVLLRQGPAAPGGAVAFREDESLFLEGIEIVAEYGEIPVVQGADGTPRVVFSRKAAAAFVISKEMRTRNDVDLATKRLTQIRNSFVRFWDDLFFKAILTHPTVVASQIVVPDPWTDSLAKVRTDLSVGKQGILAEKDGNGNELGIIPDTLVLNPLRAEALTTNDDVAKIFRGNIADKAPLYVGDLGVEIANLRILKSFRVPEDTAIILKSKACGFISDEWPQQTTEMYEDKPRQAYRADTTRLSAVGIDMPKGIRVLKGI